MNIDSYIENRVEEQLNYYSSGANKFKRLHLYLQTSIIFLGVLVPVVVNLDAGWFGSNGDIIIRIAVTIISLLLAIITGIATFRKYGDLWLSYRMTEELLKHEKYLFLTKSGPYSEEDKSEKLFVEKIESIISSEHNKFRSLIEESKRPVPKTDNSG